MTNYNTMDSNTGQVTGSADNSNTGINTGINSDSPAGSQADSTTEKKRRQIISQPIVAYKVIAVESKAILDIEHVDTEQAPDIKPNWLHSG